MLTRSADLRQAQHTSIIEDIRIWTDEAGARPADQLRAMLEDLGAAGKRLGMETNAYGLTHYNGKQVEQALDGFCQLVDASELVGRLRAVKSPAELAYVRRPGGLGDRALLAGIAATGANADEGRDPGRPAGRDLRRRRRLSATSSSSAQARRPSVPLQVRPPKVVQERPAHLWSLPASTAITVPR